MVSKIMIWSRNSYKISEKENKLTDFAQISKKVGNMCQL